MQYKSTRRQRSASRRRRQRSPSRRRTHRARERRERERTRRSRSPPRPSGFLPFFPRGASVERKGKPRDVSPSTRRVERIVDAWFLCVSFLTSLETAREYGAGEIAAAVDPFLSERRKVSVEEGIVDLTTEINLRSMVASLDVVDAHVRALAGCVEQLKTYAKSPLFLSILRVLGHACMFADLGCGPALDGEESEEQLDRLVRGSVALVDKCNLAMKSEREWIVNACRRMCEAYIKQARELNAKVLHFCGDRRKKQGDSESVDMSNVLSVPSAEDELCSLSEDQQAE